MKDTSADNLKELSEHFCVVNLVGDPLEICKVLQEYFPRAYIVSSNDVVCQMRNAIIKAEKHSFLKMFCDPHLLIIATDPSDCKDAFQSTMSQICGIREYLKRDTLFVSEKRIIDSDNLINPDFRMYVSLYTDFIA